MLKVFQMLMIYMFTGTSLLQTLIIQVFSIWDIFQRIGIAKQALAFSANLEIHFPDIEVQTWHQTITLHKNLATYIDV